jgi:aminoglycoside phosphotransferase (APT) family kinase protein
VTFWRFITGRPGDERDIATLGTVLRRLHETPAPTTFTLPPEDILGRVEPRIATAPIPEDDRRFLLRLAEDLRAKVSTLDFPLRPAPTHGDAHNENLIIRNGEPVLIDFERFAWGQPEWDLAMTATEWLTAKWWTSDEYARFCDAYGYDVTTWKDGFPVLQAVHELKMTTWLMQNVAESQEIADEYQVRMRTLRGEQSAGWRPF